MSDSRTIQTWPSGTSYTFRGDENGPVEQFEILAIEFWRQATASEQRAIRIELRAEMYGERDVLCCDSSLVDDLIKLSYETARGALAESFSMDEVRNLYADPSDWDADQCREYADDHGLELPDVPEADTPFVQRALKEPTYATALEADEGSREGEAWQTYCAALEDDGRRGWLTEAREVCREHAQDNPAEPYEWWRVSGWLCDKLHSIGEVTIDNGYGHWWGRQTTGQGYMMDGVLQRVAASFELEEVNL